MGARTARRAAQDDGRDRGPLHRARPSPHRDDGADQDRVPRRRAPASTPTGSRRSASSASGPTWRRSSAGCRRHRPRCSTTRAVRTTSSRSTGRSRPPPTQPRTRRSWNALEAEVSFRRGQTLLKRNDLPGAQRDFALALELQPKEGEHIIYAAWTRHCLGDLDVDQTRAELQRGLKAQPRAASAHYFMGMLCKEEETYDAALVEFKRAVALDRPPVRGRAGDPYPRRPSRQAREEGPVRTASASPGSRRQSRPPLRWIDTTSQTTSCEPAV